MKTESTDNRKQIIMQEDATGNRPHFDSFAYPDVRIKWNYTNKCYSVFSDREYNSGDIIEEMPVLIIDTTSEDVAYKYELNDPILLSKSISYPNVDSSFELLGHPLILPVGNFFVYRQVTHGNAEVEFSSKFNIITIRANKKIEKNQEIFIASKEGFYGHTNIPVDLESGTNLVVDSPKTQSERKGDMGCGCGKKNKKVTPILDGTEKVKKEVKKEKPSTTKEEPKFKSMVDGSTLRTIKAKKK